MRFNYLTNSSGFTRMTTAYVGHLLNSRRRPHRKALSAVASRSGHQVPKSPVRTERVHVAGKCSLSAREADLS